MTCIHTMSRSLLLTQLLRLLKHGDSQARNAVDYWIGEILSDIVLVLDQRVHAKNIPSYFQHLACLVADAKIGDIIDASNWETITNKIIYQNQIGDFPPPKVELEADISFSEVWRRLLHSSLSSDIREFLFLLVHRKIPVKERLFKIRLSPDPYCDSCLGVLDASDAVEDFQHFFCSCMKVSHVWSSIRSIINQLHHAVPPDRDILLLNFSKTKFDTEITWLLGAYLHYIWRWIHDNGNETVDKDQLFGYLRFKFKEDQLGSRAHLDSFVNDCLHV